MKIIHVLLGKANPNTMNGVNKAVHHLATEQARLGNDVEVWGLSKPNAAPPTHERAYVLRLLPLSRSRFKLSAELRSALSRLSRDAWVQLHSVFVPELYAIARFLRKRGTAYGVTPHGGYNPRSLTKNTAAKSLYLSLFERPTLAGARLVHAVGASEINDVCRLVPKADIVLVPNGQVLGFAENVVPVETGATRPIFCYCGRLAMKFKGLDLLLSGFAHYREQGGAGTLWLIGDWHDRTALENMAKRLNVSEAVVFFGAKFGTDKLQLLTGIDVFVQPSRWDGLPTGCLEAAALNKPLIVSKETNLGQAVEEYGAGYVLPENTPFEIARAFALFERKQRDGSLADVGKRACTMVAEAFSWPRVAEELASYYEARLFGAEERQ